MQINLVEKLFSVAVCLALFVLSGCTNFLVPEEGALVWEDARISVDDAGIQNAEWKTKELKLQYSIDITDNELNLSYTLEFDRSVTDSYSVTKTFFLKMSFMDDHGQVIKTVDITPMLSRYGPNTDPVSLKKSFIIPSGLSGIVFNYYGVFKGEPPEAGGDEITIFYFPYEQ